MKKKIKQFELGNVYSIETTKGLGLIQLVHIPEDKRMDVEMIRVSYNLYSEIPENLEEVFSKDFFYVRFPVKAALRKKIVHLLENVSLGDNFKIPRYFRKDHYFNQGEWIIVDKENDSIEQVKSLTPEELLYSPSEVWNDTYLKERLEEGWRLENWT